VVLQRWGLLLGALLSVPASAQVIRLEAGSSSMYRADGGSIYVQGRTYEGWLGLAALNPVRVGGALRTRVRGADLSLGDEIVLLHLPTDYFDSGRLLFTRGVAVGVRRGSTAVRVRGGVTSTVYSAPYFSTGSSDDALGMIEAETRLAPPLVLSLRDIVSRRQTHLLGLAWTPDGPLHAAITGGVGAGDRYAAAGFTYERSWLSVRAAYVEAGDRFHRVLTPQPEGSESDRENALVTVRPTRWISLSAGRNNYLQPAAAGQPVLRGTVDQLFASGTVAGTALHGAYYTSRTPGGGGTGASFNAGRDLIFRSRLEGGVYRSDPRHGAATTTFLGTLRENLSQRLQTIQTVTRTGRHTTASFGGSFLSNPVTVGVEYQTIFLPFGRQTLFDQALMLTLKLQPWGDLQAHVSSYVGPDGRVRYTAYGNQYLYRAEAAPQSSASLLRDLVRGRVLDEQGQPFAGAALRIGGQLVFTDSRGSFFVRFAKEGVQTLEVAFDQFMVPGVFETVEAPAMVRAVDETAAEETIVRIRRVRPDDRVERPALPGGDPVLPPFGPGIAGAARVARTPGTVHFGFNSAELSAPTRALLDSVSRTLTDAPGMHVRLTGHADRRGSPAYNMELSKRRAQMVYDYLIRSGIEPDRIDVGYYGKSLAPGAADPTTLAKSRRVAFWFESPPGDVNLEVDPDDRDLQVEEPPAAR